VMDDSAPAPRVNGELLGQFLGKKVLVVGEVTPIDGGRATIKTVDDKMITITLADGASFGSKFVEFEATVDGPTAVTECSRVEFGDDFDVFSYGELVKLMNGKSKDLFF